MADTGHQSGGPNNVSVSFISRTESWAFPNNPSTPLKDFHPLMTALYSLPGLLTALEKRLFPSRNAIDYLPVDAHNTQTSKSGAGKEMPGMCNDFVNGS